MIKSNSHLFCFLSNSSDLVEGILSCTCLKCSQPGFSYLSIQQVKAKLITAGHMIRISSKNIIPMSLKEQQLFSKVENFKNYS